MILVPSALGVLAHQGGWDEVGLILTPILIFAALLWVADRRARALKAAQGGGDGADDGPSAPSTDEPSPERDRDERTG